MENKTKYTQATNADIYNVHPHEYTGKKFYLLTDEHMKLGINSTNLIEYEDSYGGGYYLLTPHQIEAIWGYDDWHTQYIAEVIIPDCTVVRREVGYATNDSEYSHGFGNDYTFIHYLSARVDVIAIYDADKDEIWNILKE